MRNVFRYMIIEWKLLGRGPLFWLLLVILGTFFYLFTSGTHWSQDIGRVSIVDSMFLFPAMLMSMLLTIAAVRRDQVSQHDRLVGSLPYRSGQLHLARMMAYAIPFTLMSWVPAVLFAVRLLREGMSVSSHWLGLAVHLSSCVPFWFMIAAGYGIAYLVKQRYSYLIGIVLFIFLSYIQEMLRTALPDWSWLRLLDFTEMDFFQFDLYRGDWGFTHDELFLYKRLMYAAIALFIAVLVIWSAGSVRFEKQGKVIPGIVGIGCLILIMFTAAASVEAVSRRTASANEQAAWYLQTHEQPRYDLAGNRIVSERMQQWQHWQETYNIDQAVTYEIKIRVHGPDEIEGHVTCRVPASLAKNDRLPITLHHALEVTEARLMGRIADFEREDGTDVVWISLPETADHSEEIVLPIEISYKGKLNIWVSNSRNKLLSRYARVDARGMLLPESYGWYPIVGVHQTMSYAELYWISGNREVLHAYLQPQHVQLPVADYSIELVLPFDYPVYTNGSLTERHENGNRLIRIEGRRTRGITLAGGPLQMLEAQEGEFVSFIWNNLVKKDALETERQKFNQLYTETMRLLADLGDSSEHASIARKPHPVIIAPFGMDDAILTGSEVQLIRNQFYTRFELWNYSNYVRNLFERYEPMDFRAYDAPFFTFIAAYILNMNDEKPARLLNEENFTIGSQLDPSYVYLNRIYERFDNEQLRPFIREFWDVLKQPHDFRQSREAVLALLAKWAGE